MFTKYLLWPAAICTSVLVLFIALAGSLGPPQRAVMAASNTVEVRQLVPEQSFSVSDIVKGDKVAIREMRSDAAGVWFLLQSRSKGNFYLLKTAFSGATQGVLPLPPNIRSAGLAATGRGIATVLFKGRQGVLTEYSPVGKELLSVPLGCFLSDVLLTLQGRPATVCPDGTVTRYSQNGEAEKYASWARLGSIAEMLSSGDVAVVDQPTAQVLLCDPHSGSVRPVTEAAPEIEEARRRIAANKNAYAASAAPADPPLGTQLIAMDTAAGGSGFYVLIWPYHAATGPAVVKFSNSGELVARYQCRVTGGEHNLHKIEIANGYMFLAAVDGTVFRYKP